MAMQSKAWKAPAYRNKRFGFEVTMYVANKAK